MNETDASAQAAPPSAGEGRYDAAPLWHLGWALGVLAGGAALLAALGAISWQVILALGFAAVPGVLGFVWRPRPHERLGLVVVWAHGVAIAVLLEGGPAGPLGVWTIMPLFAGALLGAWAEGVVLAAAALAVTVLGSAAGVAPAPSPAALGGSLAAVSLVCAGGAAAAALAVLARRARPTPYSASSEPIADEPGVVAGEGAGAELEAARARIAVLERKLKATEQGKAQAYNALARVQAERNEAEAARETAEANARAKSRFLANMSHELRTPLNAIMGFSDIMRAKMFGELPGKYAEYADLIHDSGKHLMDLINDVLDMSKIEAERYTLAREEFDVREAVNAALRLMRLQADDAGISLRGVLPASALIVDADRRAVKQIVLNLVSNALKFTPRGGSVTVTAQAAANAFELVVADTGVGIAKADLQRLGRPFEQAGDAAQQAQGTGLGLSLVKAFAQLHGGEMTIESEPGEGAAVTVRLPVLVAEDPKPAPAPSAAAPVRPVHTVVGDGAHDRTPPVARREPLGRTATVVPLNPTR